MQDMVKHPGRWWTDFRGTGVKVNRAAVSVIYDAAIVRIDG